ncbi:hypothetical protein M0802_002789 [Mischocyttarus mexicanus]|nr:hypothetical protein M0802_002789 [Mischocyttarus mexicanus]
MTKLNRPIIVVAVILTEIIYGLFALSISINPNIFEENLSIKFGEPMDKCNSLEEKVIMLDNVGLDALRDHFVVSKTIKSINLENNIIEDISPNAFQSVPNLLCLNMQHNNILNLFSNFLASFNHSKLMKLNLASTASRKISSIDKSLQIIDENMEIPITLKSFLPSLTHLDISNNNLEVLPNYFRLSFLNLTNLYLSDNRLLTRLLDRIPDTIQHLYLERNRGVIEASNFPINIHSLFLNDNKFNGSINDFKKYRNLRILSIRNSNILIEKDSAFNNDKLIYLDMSLNNLTIIYPELLKNATSLQRLNLDFNNLSSLFFLNSLHSLTELSIAYNKVTYILAIYFSHLKNLTILNLRGNEIELIYENAFSNLSNLKKLDLAENVIHVLPDLWMKNLTSLRYLNLKSNRFTTLDNMFILSRSNLQRLFVGDNIFIRMEISSLIKLPISLVVYFSSVPPCEM